jgi:hypothetical protein
MHQVTLYQTNLIHSLISLYASFPYYHIGTERPLYQIGFDSHIMTVIVTNQNFLQEIYAAGIFTYKSQRFELLFQK